MTLCKIYIFLFIKKKKIFIMNLFFKFELAQIHKKKKK
jgi:hypothetical protein